MTIFLLLGWLLFSTSASAECTREFLIGATDKYVTAQAAGTANDVVALAAPNVTYTENEVPKAIPEGVLAESIKIDHNRSIHDTVNCATFTEIIAATNPHQYVIGTRILFNSDNEISLMESIVTDAGDWAFNATDLYWDSLENWDPIPEEKRDSREVIKSAGNSYFERFKNESVVVPFGVPCSRLEGGASTAPLNMTGDSCTLAGLPSTLVVTDRRFVVDETLGVVDIFLGFPGLDRSQGQKPMPDSHLFRIESGKIRYIHTVSSCVEAGCGMNGTIPPSTIRRLRHF
ncbi:uncharacterized protein F4807DRAFT_467887 [Annulohypoxylon truncatum]|uniref:uncharacterized protein n=1 Tax=Annulohypoxylon truncatum TaxID=327061 RepID=UPI00200889FD|nr:uncharacterized protein F4807DRAFT_467887 [Annulohypoxylon truncatum]KAI1209338.1 hypothetical protein F4807DRAFT_467887 [Annulohypoxylon truncatum]